MFVQVLWIEAFIVRFAVSAYVSEVHLQQMTPFPVTLGSRLHWRLTPKKGDVYDNSGGVTIDLDNKVIGSWNSECTPFSEKPPSIAFCEVGKGSTIDLYFIPKRENYGQRILITFFPNIGTIFNRLGQVLLNTTIQLTKHPSFLNMSISLESAPDFVRHAPSELKLKPPIFLHGSLARVQCKTDGALPPQPISFAIVCDNPPRAAVEQERQAKAKIGHPFEISYTYYSFRSPPTDEELAEKMALGYAQSIMDESGIARSQDNLTLSATLPINSKAHDCTIYCRLMDKEEHERLTVYYQTTVAYILPSPIDGLMRVGSSLNCYADGYPEPTISLSLRQPMRQYHRRPLIDPNDYRATTSSLPPVDHFVDNSDIAATTRIGLRPDEYTIRGSKFTLAYNATPGVELLLVCSAGNALPNAFDFLGYNKTITVARFTVAAISYSSIGIVAGICMAILFCATIVILLMVYLRRRQKYASNAIQTRNQMANAADANGAKTVGVAGQGNQDAITGSGDHGVYGLKDNRKLYKMRSSIDVAEDESPQRCLFSRSPPPLQTSPADGVEYAKLTLASTSQDYIIFGGTSKRGVHVATAYSTLGRTSSAGRIRRGPLSGTFSVAASLQHLPRSHAHGADGSGQENSTERASALQPKAYASQLVLEQQQEATRAILNMQSNAASVLV